MDLYEYKKQWLAAFANGISRQRIKKHVIGTGDLIWHVFSWGLLPQGCFLTGDDARHAYDKIGRYPKETALFIEPFREAETFSLPVHRATSKALEEYVEIYVTANDFSWTYIKTHEGDMCGPYFYQLKKEKRT